MNEANQSSFRSTQLNKKKKGYSNIWSQNYNAVICPALAFNKSSFKEQDKVD